MRDYYFYYLKEFLKKFGPSWYFKWFQPQPVESIREYFGESIGIYFAFVGTYNEMQHIAKKPTEFIHLFIIVIVVDVGVHCFFFFLIFFRNRILYVGTRRAGYSGHCAIFHARQLRTIFLCILHYLANGKAFMHAHALMHVFQLASNVIFNIVVVVMVTIFPDVSRNMETQVLGAGLSLGHDIYDQSRYTAHRLLWQNTQGPHHQQTAATISHMENICAHVLRIDAIDSDMHDAGRHSGHFTVPSRGVCAEYGRF